MKTNAILLCFLLLVISNVAQSQTLQATENEALVNVSVANFNEKPKKGETILFVDTKTKKEIKGISDAKGKIALLLPKGASYDVRYVVISDKTEYSTIEVPNEPGLFSFDIKINIEMPKTYVLQNVYFDTGKATLRPESYKSLNDLVASLKLKESMVIEISGHTDNIGSPESNMKLSQERANAVKAYLIKNGISAVRLTSKGYGDTKPVDDNQTEMGRQKNRRTEVQIIQE